LYIRAGKKLCVRSLVTKVLTHAIFLLHFSSQFNAIENGIAVTKLMQIFSRQSAMMDALISHFTEQMKRRKDSTDASVAAAGANGAGAGGGVIDPSIDIELNGKYSQTINIHIARDHGRRARC
jgi:hypothetical protein